MQNATKPRKTFSMQYTQEPNAHMPLEYPHISEQQKERKRLKEMHQQLELNRYLNESDSSFESFRNREE